MGATCVGDRHCSDSAITWQVTLEARQAPVRTDNFAVFFAQTCSDCRLNTPLRPEDVRIAVYGPENWIQLLLRHSLS